MQPYLRARAGLYRFISGENGQGEICIMLVDLAASLLNGPLSMSRSSCHVGLRHSSGKSWRLGDCASRRSSLTALGGYMSSERKPTRRCFRLVYQEHGILVGAVRDPHQSLCMNNSLISLSTSVSLAE
jgi:hypothetical protein